MDARTEFQEKLKYYSALEKKVRRQLLKDENEEAIKTLIQIIQGYKSIGVIEKAKLLEEELANFASASNLNLQQFYESAGTVEEPEKPSARSDDSGQILGFIESLEKKVKRRILQGKTQEAITDLKYIISELRNLRNFEKAELLEATLNQFIAELAASSSGPSVPFVTTPQTQFAPQVYSLPRPASPPAPAPPAFARAPPAVNPNSEFAPNIADLLPGARPRAQPPMPPQVPMAPPAHPPIATPASPPSVAITPPLQPSTLPVPPNATPSATLKDQPYSDEELLLKKLFEIKDMLGKK